MLHKLKPTPAKDQAAKTATPEKETTTPASQSIEKQNEAQDQGKAEKAPQPFEDLEAITGARSTFTQDG